MSIKKRGLRALLAASTCIGCVAVAIFAVRTFFVDETPAMQQSPRLILNPAPAPDYPVNENGQTYGSAGLARTPDEEPDLILACGIDGTEGYVLKTDADGFQPKTPEEALKWQSERPEFRMIPLYKSDGETVIGEFKVGGGTAAELSSEEAAQGITIEDKMDAALAEKEPPKE